VANLCTVAHCLIRQIFTVAGILAAIVFCNIQLETFLTHAVIWSMIWERVGAAGGGRL